MRGKATWGSIVHLKQKFSEPGNRKKKIKGCGKDGRPRDTPPLQQSTFSFGRAWWMRLSKFGCNFELLLDQRGLGVSRVATRLVEAEELAAGESGSELVFFFFQKVRGVLTLTDLTLDVRGGRTGAKLPVRCEA